VKSPTGVDLVSETRTYFRNPVGQVTASYVVEGDERSTRSALAAPFNSFFTASNFVRLHNPETGPESAVVEAYDQGGNLLGAVPVTVAATSTIELDLNASLGFGVALDSIGLVRVLPSNPGTIFGDVLRVKTLSTDGSVVDFAKPIPLR